VSHSAKRSGTRAMRCAWASAGPSACAISWKIVLIAHRLDSGHRVELLAAHTLVDTLVHAVRAPVAIMERQTEQVRGAVEQAVIASPCVDPDAAQRRLRSRERKPSSVSANSPRMFQCRPSGRRTARLAKRWITSSETVSCSTRPRTTRPLSAPRSTAAEAREAVKTEPCHSVSHFLCPAGRSPS